MKKSSAMTLFLHWLKTTEMFSRPSRQVPGRWQLYEFYYEPEGQLIHVEKEDLSVKNIRWEIIINRDGKFSQQSNLAVKFLNGMSDCRWSLSGNYIKLTHPVNEKEHEEIQFAVVKDNLRLLKKESDGKIRFFGFFSRIE
jgi:hypothetical protein